MTPTSSSEPVSRIPFTAQDEANIKALSAWMSGSAFLTVVGVAVSLVMFCIALNRGHANFGVMIDVMIKIMLAVWLFQAATAFRKIATTDEADQHYLVRGFSKLRTGTLLVLLEVLGCLPLKKFRSPPNQQQPNFLIATKRIETED